MKLKTEIKTYYHDYDKVLKSLRTAIDLYKKKYVYLNKKKFFFNILEVELSDGGSAVGNLLDATGAAHVGFPIAWANSFMTSVAGSITNVLCSKLEMRFTKLQD